MLKYLNGIMYFFILLWMSSPIVMAQTEVQVSQDSLQAYIGKQITYCNHVYGTYQGKGEKSPIMLNLGAAYPNQSLTVVIFQRDLPNFKYNPLTDLKDEDICVTGQVEIYRDKLQIIAKKETQILLQEKAE